MTSLRTFLVAFGSFAALVASQSAFSQNPVIFSASGDEVTVDPIVTNFRTALQGTPDGEQRIVWDGVSDLAAVPMASTQFQNRGVLLTNPNGGTVQVSLNDPNPLHQFGDVNPGFPQIFEPFSGDQLFTAIGGNQVQVDFVIPLTFTPALTRGFGVVFSDVDVFGPTTIQLFDANNNPIGLAEKAPASVPPGGPEDESFSFLGLLFDNPVIRRAVITNGNFGISSGFSEGKDLVVMDDYLFATPQQAVPEPSTWLLVIAGLGVVGWFRRGRMV